MQDVQKEKANRDIYIDNVGISDIKYPLKIKQKGGGIQSTISELTMSVSLPKEFRGTHMSRFMSILHNFEEIETQILPNILDEMISKLQADNSYIKISFPYFINKVSPITYNKGLMNYNCTFYACAKNSTKEVGLKVDVPVTSVCPCSKTISDRGAHNQRGIIETKVLSKDTQKETIWIEDIIEMAESSASCSLYPLLKREDEKFVTEKAYDNPVFVEDMAREMAWKLQNRNITPFEIKVTNQESIHNHSAFARIVNGKFELV